MDTNGDQCVDKDEFHSWFDMHKRKQVQGPDHSTDEPSGTDTPIGITKGELHAWYRYRIKNTVQTPFDALYGTTTEKAYWWWALLLWLKVAINLLHSWGRAFESDSLPWHMWMHAGLALFLCVSVNTQPYKNPVDYKVEVAA